MLPVVLALRYYYSIQHAKEYMTHVEGFETNLVYPRSIVDLHTVQRGEEIDEEARNQNRTCYTVWKKHC